MASDDVARNFRRENMRNDSGVRRETGGIEMPAGRSFQTAPVTERVERP